MKKINTVLFDLDGTLIDTNEIIVKSYQVAYQKHLPDKMPSREKIIEQIGPTLQTIFSSYTNDENLVQTMIKTYRAYYTANEFDYFSLYPDVVETLEILKSMGIKLGIVTSKFKEAAWPSFTHYKLDQYFDCFIALDDVTTPKPDKEPVNKAISCLDDVDLAIMIGDNKSDIMSGKNAGILSAGVAWSIKGEAYLNEVNPDFMLKTMHDIITIIKDYKEEN